MHCPDCHDAEAASDGLLDRIMDACVTIGRDVLHDFSRVAGLLTATSAHTGTDVDAHASARRMGRSADRNRWPTCPIEQAEQTLRNKAGSRGNRRAGRLGRSGHR